MAAAIKALNAKIRANPVLDYVCSTHFFGPVSNFGIPIAAVLDTQKSPELVSGPMTLALCGYSGVFMRYAFAVTPKNYLLFGCHIVNFTAQVTQGYRYINYHHFGGKQLEAEMKKAASKVEGKAQELLADAKSGLKTAEAKVKEEVNKVTAR